MIFLSDSFDLKTCTLNFKKLNTYTIQISVDTKREASDSEFLGNLEEIPGYYMHGVTYSICESSTTQHCVIIC